MEEQSEFQKKYWERVNAGREKVLSTENDVQVISEKGYERSCEEDFILEIINKLPSQQNQEECLENGNIPEDIDQPFSWPKQDECHKKDAIPFPKVLKCPSSQQNVINDAPQKDKIRYFQFPLFLLREMLIDKETTFNKIIIYGTYNYAKRIRYNLTEVARQLIYAYYRKKDDLTEYLLESIDNYAQEEKIYIDQETYGFQGKEFNPEFQIEELLQIFETDQKFKESSIEFYQLKQAINLFKIQGNYKYILSEGEKIEKNIPKHEPFPMINTKLAFSVRDNNSTEYELAFFLLYISIRSILGRKVYCRTNKMMMICRMFGYASKKHLPDNMRPEILELFNKYSKRYHIDRLILYMKADWHIIIYSQNIRGLYVGIKKDDKSLESMIEVAERRKKKNKFALIKKEEQEARQKVLELLSN